MDSNERFVSVMAVLRYAKREEGGKIVSPTEYWTHRCRSRDRERQVMRRVRMDEVRAPACGDPEDKDGWVKPYGTGWGG